MFSSRNKKNIDSFWLIRHFFQPDSVYCLLCWGLTTRQPLWVILCRLPEKGRKEIEEIVEEMKERNREERGTGMKGKKQNKNIPPLPLPTSTIAGLAQL